MAIILALLLYLIMYIWYRGTGIEESQEVKLYFKDYIQRLSALHDDESIPKKAFNMVFLIKDDDPDYMDRDVLYSILDKDTKRADAYWFINVKVMDVPDEMTYSVENYGPSIIGNFKFCMIRKVLREDGSLTGIDKFVMSLKYAIRRAVGSPSRWYGIDTASSIIEYVPLFIQAKKNDKTITRI